MSACSGPSTDTRLRSVAASEDGKKRRRILLVGLDAADWTAIDPLVQAGKLPFFARLKEQGRTGLMVSTPPLLSPILWTTIATGRHPEDHGVLDFMMDTPAGDQRPVSAAERRVPALWNLFSAAGRRVAVVGWWATWPAEDVRGTIVSDRVAPQLRPDVPRLDDRAISPAAQASRLAAAIVSPAALSLDQMRAYVPLSPSELDAAVSAGRQASPGLYKNKIAHLAAVVAGTRSYSAIAERLVSESSPDFLAVYLEGIDTVSHLFVRDSVRGPTAIAAAYRDADALLGRLANATLPDTWIVVCSDHGFYSPAASITEDPADLAGAASAWHRPYGIVAAIEAGALAGGQQSAAASIGHITPLDVAPTVLHAAGLPIGDRMPGRVVDGLLPPDLRARPVAKASFADVGPAVPSGSSYSPVDADLKARLQALGYVDAASTSLARQNLGEILYRRGRLAAAERELRVVVDRQPTNVAALLWLAKTCRDQGRSREALRLYERAAVGTSGRGEALVEAAEVAASAGWLQEGRRIVDQGSNAPSTAVSAHVARAILMRASGDDRGAEHELRGALARDPLSFEALSRLLDLLAATGRVRGALPLFQNAAKRAAASPRHLALLGAAYLGSADARAAEAPLQRALELAPDGSALRLDLARAQISQRKLEAAALTLSSADPSRERSLLLGALTSLQEKWADAAVHYQAALEGGSPQPDVLNGLGWAKLKLGKKGEAADLFYRSLALDRNQPEVDRLVTQLAPRPAGSPR